MPRLFFLFLPLLFPALLLPRPNPARSAARCTPGWATVHPLDCLRLGANPRFVHNEKVSSNCKTARRIWLGHGPKGPRKEERLWPECRGRRWTDGGEAPRDR